MIADKKNIDKYFIALLAVILFGVIIIGFLNPFLKNNLENNWEDESKEYTFKISEKIQDKFDQKSNELISFSDELKKQLKQQNKLEKEKIFNSIPEADEEEFIVHFFDSNKKLIYWSENSFLDSTDDYYDDKIGQSFFINKKGKVFFSYYDTISTKNNHYSLIVSSLIYRKIDLREKENTVIDSLKSNLNSEVDFDFYESANIKKDGRKYSFPILNNFKNKIGVATVNKPTLSFAQQEIDRKTKVAQSLLIVLFLLILFIFVNRKNKSSKFISWIIYSSEIILLRITLFVLEIPSGFWKTELTNPMNFSSRFGFGIVSSPFEFFLTALALFTIILLFQIRIEELLKQKSIKVFENHFVKYFVTGVIVFLLLLIWRACGASIRSVIFDSNIRYFKEFQLIPEPVVALMSLNILLLGMIIIISSSILVGFLFFILDDKRKKYIYVFLFIQIVGLVYDKLQLQPQGTDLIRFVFITATFLLVWFSQSLNNKVITKLILYSFVASIISVSMLTYYNSELERESLKNTAYDLVRVREPQLNFMVYQTLQEASNEFKNFKNQELDYDYLAFQIWSKSFFRTEGIETSIEFFDERKMFLGGFSSSIEQNNQIDLREIKFQDEIIVGKINSTYSDDVFIYGLMPIELSGKLNYILISIKIHNNIPSKKTFSTFRNEGKGISSSLNVDNIKTFFVDNYGNIYSDEMINLSDEDYENIKEMLVKNIEESWGKIKLSDENYFAYFLNDKTNGESQIICVAKPEKNFSWNLSDFFKIFFIHAFIITALLVLFLFVNYKKYSERFYSFRTKLALSLFILSILPMIFISNYIRTIIDENNNKILRESLKEKIVQVKNIIDKKLVGQALNEFAIYQSINDEYGINFSVYKNNRLQYSSFINLYSSGLMSSNLDYEAFANIRTAKSKIFFATENISGKNSNAVFCELESGAIIEVNDITNPINLALSKFDFDVFLFGIFSLLLVIIIILSTILSLQISKPISTLTNATKSIADGDLDYEIKIETNDEFNELAKAFNSMTKKLKQSQIELAQFEREEAWREMAKQVAHEIKNPLTPMKLSVQQLIAAHKDKSNKYEEIFNKVTETILLQIETLKNIASEFSNFARMPKMNLENVEIISAINEAVMLFVDEKKSVNINSQNDKIIVLADKDHLKRTIINMIRNSFQAKASNVIIEIFADELNAFIKVKDDGGGIDESILPKIFESNYTTKEKGMGLGLSMAKKYFESLNGSIKVEATNKNGTTFLIKIPLLKK